MAKSKSIYYAVTTGREGRCRPDRHHGVVAFASPTELGDYIFYILDKMGFAPECADQVDFAEMCRYPESFAIFQAATRVSKCRAGSGDCVLEFHMMSEAKALKMLEDDR